VENASNDLDVFLVKATNKEDLNIKFELNSGLKSSLEIPFYIGAVKKKW
jgi:hypothetical protein